MRWVWAERKAGNGTTRPPPLHVLRATEDSGDGPGIKRGELISRRGSGDIEDGPATSGFECRLPLP